MQEISHSLSMDFAKKILEKYGWQEGDALGKSNNGIAVPIKASLKFDKAGLGVDRATEFNDHWWERCFNEAASNVSVNVEKDGRVSTSRKDGQEAVEISTKGFSARKLKKAKDQQKQSDDGIIYDHFLKGALLTHEGGEVENMERIKSEDIAVAKVKVLTDEELFKACGGRTAHKGARHGLKLSGKLARLEQQEREMLAKMQGKPVAKQLNTATEVVETVKIKKKKRKKDKYLETDDASLENPTDNVEIEEDSTKKSRKSESENVGMEPPAKSKKKKKKRKHMEE